MVIFYPDICSNFTDISMYNKYLKIILNIKVTKTKINHKTENINKLH